ncbi:uncharacterized protein BDR25DRAFT_362932 [Lindgomyces ingoldianus]|uniref:Uncharacterized protein n=1 Tax=Lindgomyces ingoldianus TaxID=673940 RepID=A0ACB6Q9X7_9PLEO|nr:uncharacterized protein BDR25DRAFT_362932 [Lindgomyces ingoldianus]KAF2463388.1 hypothetical protein BDR25DRAFT_362932 [Lindgomyces ingoldianus]
MDCPINLRLSLLEPSVYNTSLLSQIMPPTRLQYIFMFFSVSTRIFTPTVVTVIDMERNCKPEHSAQNKGFTRDFAINHSISMIWLWPYAPLPTHLKCGAQLTRRGLSRDPIDEGFLANLITYHYKMSDINAINFLEPCWKSLCIRLWKLFENAPRVGITYEKASYKYSLKSPGFTCASDTDEYRDKII